MGSLQIRWLSHMFDMCQVANKIVFTLHCFFFLVLPTVFRISTQIVLEGQEGGGGGGCRSQ